MNPVYTKSIVLSDGSTYTPQKNERPEYPCRGCEMWDDCVKQTDPCDRYMDYEHKLALWKLTVFD